MSDTAENLAAPSSDSPPDAPSSVPAIRPVSQPVSQPVSWLPLWITLLSFAAILASIAVLKPIKPAAENVQPAGLFVFALAALLCTTAALFDASTNRIPNPLTYTAILLGLLLNCLPVIARLTLSTNAFSTFQAWLGSPGPQQALLGFAICIVIGALSVLVGGMGGGDAKLMVALGSLLGLGQVGVALITALLIAVAYSIINLIIRGRLNVVVRLAATQLIELFFLKRWTPPDPIDTPDKGFKGKIALAVPLALGVIISRIIPLRTLTFGLIDA